MKFIGGLWNPLQLRLLIVSLKVLGVKTEPPSVIGYILHVLLGVITVFSLLENLYTRIFFNLPLL